ncbi:hypothetical protein E2542_SST04170 [Spatholobus suberectus]|nr:hypothetical protein E2542_SST04170 [Spatholobus suberectus]
MMKGEIEEWELTCFLSGSTRWVGLMPLFLFGFLSVNPLSLSQVKRVKGKIMMQSQNSVAVVIVLWKKERTADGLKHY